jgi:hypothetical protein
VGPSKAVVRRLHELRLVDGADVLDAPPWPCSWATVFRSSKSCRWYWCRSCPRVDDHIAEVGEVVVGQDPEVAVDRIANPDVAAEARIQAARSADVAAEVVRL